MKLFICTGGKGERLYPLTKDIPKPLVKIAGRPILYHTIQWAKKHNIKDIVMMNGHKAEKIIEHFKNGGDFGVNIIHSNEPYPLGSGGPLKFAEKHIDGRFVYISGDIFCNVNLNRMLEFHDKNNANMTIHVHKSLHPHDSDILQIDGAGRIIKFVSKHDEHTGAGDLSNSGLCIIEPKVIELINKDVFTFETYLYPRILGSNLRFFAYNTDEFILDVGTFDRIKQCEEFLANHPELLS